MARKKKSKRDARGYQQTAVVPTLKNKATAAVVAANKTVPRFTPALPFAMTATIQNRLDDLLLLKNQMSETYDDEDSPTQHRGNMLQPQGRSDRFVKRVTTIYDDLVHAGFQFSDIRAAFVAQKSYDVTLDSVLDWLCLHLPTNDLPPLFTEGVVRDDADQMTTDSSTLDVFVPVAPQPTLLQEKTSQEEMTRASESTAPPPSSNPIASKPADDNDDQDLKDQKKRLLEQYQYIDDGEEEDQTSGATPNNSIGSNGAVQGENNSDDGDDAAEPAAPRAVLTPDEIDLQKLQSELAALRLDLADEAGNYMRSKYEIKDMHKRAKQLTKQVQGLERKVEKHTRERESQLATSTIKDVPTSPEEILNEDEKEEMGGMLSIFGNNSDEEEDEEGLDESAPVQDDGSAAETPQMKRIPENSVPKSWTGKTPKQVFDEWCRKLKAKPKFHKTSLNGCSLHVKLHKKNPIEVEYSGPAPSYQDSQHFAALLALYQASPDLPIYRLLPPFYRDLWKEWVERDLQALSLEARDEKQQHDDRVEELINAIDESVKQNTPATAKEAHGHDRESPESPLHREDIASWEDIASDQESDVGNDAVINSGPTKDGLSLKKWFDKRQESDAYGRMAEGRASLPIAQFQDKILATIEDNPVTIICAETGAGKTTQCPQFLLEKALNDGKGDRAHIICTQPRRVAATSVAERVSDEMGEQSVGGIVGYQIRLESRKSSSTRLTFCTTGVILRRLVEDPSLTGVSHVVVDEVHERQWQIDVLLVMLRTLLRGSRPDLKVILMSATLDADLFRTFYGGAPIVNVPGRTFPVRSYYLEDLIEATNHVIEENSRYALRQYDNRETASLWVTTKGGERKRQTVSLDSEVQNEVSEDFAGYSMSTRRSMDRVDETQLNYDLVEDVLLFILSQRESCAEQLAPPEGVDVSRGAVLIFLPGAGEIRALSERLNGSRVFGNQSDFCICQLHSMLSSADQRLAFSKPRGGCQKIILATNIAETSVTIPDVVCVLDCGRVREVRYDRRTATRRLVPTWCSRASVKQRAGRAGRVQPGLCLKLFSTKTEKGAMQTNTVPEIRRMPLEEVCLNVLASGYSDSCRTFLTQTPEAPTDTAISKALEVLAEIGAIARSDTLKTEKLTPLGLHISRLPVDVRMGKMMVFGALFSCIETIVSIVAGLSASRSPFLQPLKAQQQAKACHARFTHQQSDFLTLYNVWEAFNNCETTNDARKFCQQNYLSYTILREIEDARSQYLDHLAGAGFLDRDICGYDSRKRRFNDSHLIASVYNTHGRHEAVVHAIVCAGVYPNVAQFVTGEAGLYHDQERLWVHQGSVNSKVDSRQCKGLPSSWIAFQEKFGTNEKRVSVSTTCFIHPFALILFGGDTVVTHLQRLATVDKWIQLPMAAKTAVILVELRSQLDKVLTSVVKERGNDVAEGKRVQKNRKDSAAKMLNGIVDLFL